MVEKDSYVTGGVFFKKKVEKIAPLFYVLFPFFRTPESFFLQVKKKDTSFVVLNKLFFFKRKREKKNYIVTIAQKQS